MRKTGIAGHFNRGVLAAAALILVMLMGLCFDCFGMRSCAATEGTVTATSANVRKEANPGSEKVGGAVQGAKVTINSEVTGTDGNIWYQVTVDANISGYIRSDLVKKSGDSAASGGTTVTMNPTVPVEALQTVEATVLGEANVPVRVRADASTDSGIVAQVNPGTKVTVKGRATGGDGQVWYQVMYPDNGATVEGFIRNDYLSIAGEIVPAGEGTSPEGGDTQAPSGGSQPEESGKPYDTSLTDKGWYLMDYEANYKYNIADLLAAAQASQDNLAKAEKVEKSLGGLKIAVVVLVVVVVLAVGAATILFFKLRDVMDEAYFTAVEKETMRERSGSRGGASRDSRPAGKNTVPTIGAKSGQSGRPAPAGAGRQGAGTREAAGRPASQAVRKEQGAQQARPASQGRTVMPPSGGARPTVAQARPAGPQGQSRPQPSAQVRPAAPGQGRQPGVRPQSGQSPMAAKPQGQASVPRQAAKPQAGQENWKSRNFMNEDDDEFEFEFLNWEGEDDPQ